MCGILAIASVAHPVDLRSAERVRDLMAHRGPDGAGLWTSANHPGVVLGHRRLAVLDPSEAGRQPMADGRMVLTYNGELYNDAELRRELGALGVIFTTRCDTETVLAAISAWGTDALAKLRGMYGLAVYDTRRRTLLVARDPLGVKPVYVWRSRTAVIAASEVRAIVEHPWAPRRPDPATISAYMTTIRTTMGRRTLFEGVEILMPGEWVEFDLNGGEITERRGDVWRGLRASAYDIGTAVRESVEAHLRSDVPICCLLSGGLDSSIIATVAMRKLGALKSYCSGCPDGTALAPSDDFSFARRVASDIGSVHTEAPVTREVFARRWAEMVFSTGLPMSTPNEVAINEVARSLRADGNVVTLSGEGADELFGGYGAVLGPAMAFESAHLGMDDSAWARAAAEHSIDAVAWTPRSAKKDVLSPSMLAASGHDGELVWWYEHEFGELLGRVGDRREAHLALQRRVNLAGLLLRLDQATMLESVESRTPFADVAVARAAEALPMAGRFDAGPPPRTKIALRRAFAGDLPESVVRREKASFPLPFQDWLVDCVAPAFDGRFARDVFAHGVLEAIRADPGRVWSVSWPIVNLAMWGRRWWG